MTSNESMRMELVPTKNIMVFTICFLLSSACWRY